MGNSKEDAKSKSYWALEEDKKKKGKTKDLPKSDNKGTEKNK